MSEQERYLTVSALSQYINRKFVNDPHLKTVYVIGEASNVSHKTNGYIYFNLKDDKASIKVVSFVFARQKKAPFKIEEGQKLLVVGHVTTYDQGSNYQIQMTHFELAGVGALFEQLKQLENKLRQEGLFDLPKKAIPAFPSKIAILTSDTGAVLHDIQTTVLRRFPIVQLEVYPTIVQGKGSVESILNNLNRVLDKQDEYDTVIIGRGGGSIEDLWSFNDERVVCAVSQFPLPIISCVGHETDTTLIDYVSDKRAATPTAAAELATPKLNEVEDKLSDFTYRLRSVMAKQLDQLRKRYDVLSQSYVFTQSERLYDPYYQKIQDYQDKLHHHVQMQLQQLKNRLDNLQLAYIKVNPAITIDDYNGKLRLLQQQLDSHLKHYMTQKNNQLEIIIHQLDALSPMNRLKRGYSVSSVDGKVVTSIQDVKKGQQIAIEVYDGVIEATINSVVEKDRNYGN